MAAITLGDAKQILRDRNVLDTSARGERDYLRVVNGALALLQTGRLWPFLRRVAYIQAAAPYSDGTVIPVADSTGVTGVAPASFSTSVVSQMIRFNGENRSYGIAARPGTGALTLDTAYKGDSGGEEVAYEITQERIALPALFRCLEKPNKGDYLHRLTPIDISDLLNEHRAVQQVGEPEFYSFEFIENSSGNPEAYLWLYPAPGAALSIQFPYYKWLPKVTSDAAVLGLPDQGVSEIIFWQYALAFVYQMQGKITEFQAQVGAAEAFAQNALGSFAPFQERYPGRPPYRTSAERRREPYLRLGAGILDEDE